jgi:hypothetical protein
VGDCMVLLMIVMKVVLVLPDVPAKYCSPAKLVVLVVLVVMQALRVAGYLCS